MKVLLISINTCSDPYVVYPLGLSVVANAVKKAGHEVKQIDFLAMGSSFARLETLIREFAADATGISIRNVDSVNSTRENDHFIDNAARIVKFLRSLSDSPVFLGGSGFSLMPEEILSLTGADYGIVGEGETAVTNLLQKLSKDQKSGALSSKRTIKPQGALYEPELVKFYHDQTHMIPVQTKRGCSFNCVYCSYPALEGHRIKPREPEEVIDNILFLQKKCKVELIYFVDSVFNDPAGCYIELLELMAKRKIKIPWAAFISPYKLDSDTVNLMVRTGFCWADVGGDGACDATLKGLGKSFLFKDIYDVCNLLRRKKVNVSNSFMFGGPGETQATVHEGIKNIISLDWVTSTVFMGIRILPGTPIAETAKAQGILPENHNMLEPLYYIAPGLDAKWLKNTLTAGFRNAGHCIFPPHAKNRQLQAIHRIGYNKIKEITANSEK